MMNIILLTFIRWKPEKPTASLLRAPGSINPHAVFNYSPFSSISRY